MIAVLSQHVSMFQTVLAMDSAWIMMFAGAMWAGLESIVHNTHANTWIIAQVLSLKPLLKACSLISYHLLSIFRYSSPLNFLRFLLV